MRDIRLAWRGLARSPGYTATAVLTLMLSIGAAAAMFGMLYALVLKPLPVPNPHELAQVTVFNHLNSNGDMTWRQYRALAARQTVFKSLFTSILQGVLTVETSRSTHQSAVAAVSGNYYQELGAQPAIGRLIQPADLDDAATTAEPVAVLSWDFWQREFGGSADVLGQVLKAEGTPLTIIGVAPRGFLGLSIAVEHDITVPLLVMPALLDNRPAMIDGTSSWVSTTGRLADGVTLAQARSQIEAMWPDILAQAAPQKYLSTQKEDYFKRRVSVNAGATGLERFLRNRYADPLYALLGIAGLVVLIAAANLASLVFARVEARRQELGVRLALGSGRLRVIREFGAEGLLLGLAGSVLGLALAAFSSRWLIGFLMQDYAVRTAVDVSPGPLVVGVAMAAGTGIAMCATVASAILMTRRDTLALIPGGARTVARSWMVGRAMIGVQIALSIVLLSHTGLLVRSVTAMTSIDSGLSRDEVIVAFPTERVGAYRDLAPGPYYRMALERVRALPGVAAAAFVTYKPEGGALPPEPVGRAGTTVADGDVTAEWPQVSPGFFDTLGIALVRGRDFTFADTDTSPKVAVISEELERRLFGAGQGLGAHLRVSRRAEWQQVQVVGIARNARVFDVRRANTSIIYTAAIQSGPLANYKSLVARTPAGNAAAIKQAIDALGVEYIRRTQTLEYARGRTVLQERVMAGLGSAFGLVSLVLVSVGVYGLLSYVLSLRRKEFGIRLALGADPARVAAQLTGSVAVVTVLGVVSGLLLTIVTTPALRSLLVNTSPYDPMTLALASILLLVVGGVAAIAPARRAARVEPLTELRQS